MEDRALPVGTITFFFSDIEGSTKLLQRLGEERYRVLVEGHHALVREAIRERGGIDIATEGDSFFAVFRSATDAVETAVAIQGSLSVRDPAFGEWLKVRIGIHTGEGRLGGDNYVGLDVNRMARIAAAGHGGQILVSETTKALVGERLRRRIGLRDLGLQGSRICPGRSTSISSWHPACPPSFLR